MIAINTNSLGTMTLEEIGCEIKGINKGTYYIYVDLRNGDINIGKPSKCKKNEVVIGKVSFHDDLKKKTFIEFYRNVWQVIKDYYKTCLICRTRAQKMFGKKLVEKFNPVRKYTNPRYACSEPMRMYNKNVLTYNVA